MHGTIELLHMQPLLLLLFTVGVCVGTLSIFIYFLELFQETFLR